MTPEISRSPSYSLHFVKFDDEGWLFPSRGLNGYEESMGDAHEQIDTFGQVSETIEMSIPAASICLIRTA